VPSAIHASTPKHVGQDGEPNRPEKNETENHRDQPRGPAEIIQSFNHLCHHHPLLGSGCKCILHSHKWESKGRIQVEAEMIFDCYAISSFIRATATAPMRLKPFHAVSPMARGFASGDDRSVP
jgi:hypothetical protein